MAQRIPPGFHIPTGFYDGPEVRSIPKRIRTAAVGVFALAGNYAATRLSDGYVDDETLRELGCGPAIREALKNTRGREGQLDPIWVEAEAGIRFTKWSKWQRTNAEVTAHRDAEAARKREARARAKKGGRTSTNEVLTDSDATVLAQDPISDPIAFDSKTPRPATTPKRPAGRLPESGQSETETETEITTRDSPLASTEREQAPVWEERGQERGRSDPVHHSAARLVSTLVPANTPAAVKTALRLAASQLIVGDGMAPEIVAEALRRWTARPDAGPGLLPHIASTVLREGTAPAPQSKARTVAEWALEARQREQAQQPSRKAIES